MLKFKKRLSSSVIFFLAFFSLSLHNATEKIGEKVKNSGNIKSSLKFVFHFVCWDGRFDTCFQAGFDWWALWRQDLCAQAHRGAAARLGPVHGDGGAFDHAGWRLQVPRQRPGEARGAAGLRDGADPAADADGGLLPSGAPLHWPPFWGGV